MQKNKVWKVGANFWKCSNENAALLELFNVYLAKHPCTNFIDLSDNLTLPREENVVVPPVTKFEQTFYVNPEDVPEPLIPDCSQTLQDEGSNPQETGSNPLDTGSNVPEVVAETNLSQVVK